MKWNTSAAYYLQISTTALDVARTKLRVALATQLWSMDSMEYTSGPADPGRPAHSRGPAVMRRQLVNSALTPTSVP